MEDGGQMTDDRGQRTEARRREEIFVSASPHPPVPVKGLKTWKQPEISRSIGERTSVWTSLAQNANVSNGILKSLDPWPSTHKNHKTLPFRAVSSKGGRSPQTPDFRRDYGTRRRRDTGTRGSGGARMLLNLPGVSTGPHEPPWSGNLLQLIGEITT
jgi:hypothetical protein